MATQNELATMSLAELFDQFQSMRRHHGYICSKLKDGVYPDSEAVRVGELVDEVAAQLRQRVANWREER